jgi:photosystem II stability/assembly factor-like uncharacterized protein
LSWSPIAPSGIGFSLANPDIIHVNFLSADTGYAIAGSLAYPMYKGTLYKTVDSGKTWQSINAGNIAMARTFFFNSRNGYGVGSAFFAGNTVVRQINGSWNPEQYFSFDPSRFLHGIDFRNSSVGIVGGWGGKVYRTFNGGVSWDTVQTAVDSMVNALKFLDDRTIMGATDNDGGAIIISRDTGRTWQIDFNTLTFAYPDIKGLAVSRRDSFIAVGHGQFPSSGIILWYDSTFPNNHMTTQRLNAVAMQNDSIAYIVGDSGMILTNRQTSSLGLPNKAGDISFRCYPNPASGYFCTEARREHSLSLYDVSGRLIWSQAQRASKHRVPTAALSTGVYVIQASTADGSVHHERLLVE